MKLSRITESFSALYGTLIRPEKEFYHLNDRPIWFSSFLILCVGKMLVEYLHLSVELKVIASSVLSTLEPDKTETAMQFFSATSGIAIALMPAAIIIKNLITAGLLYGMINLWTDRVRFKKLFSVAIHSWIIVLIAKYCNLLILNLKGTDQLLYLDDLKVNLGLDILLKGNENIFIKTIFENITIFSLWYLVVLTIGVAIVSGMSLKKASIAVLFVWAMNICFRVGQAMWIRGIEASFR